MTLVLKIYLVLFPLIFSGDIFFSQSLEQSIEEEKEILLVFSGSDWCTFCIRFNDLILENEKSGKAIGDKYIIHVADFPKRKKLSKIKISENEWRAESYNPKGTFPKIVIIDPISQDYKTIIYHPGKEEQFVLQLKLNK